MGNTTIEEVRPMRAGPGSVEATSLTPAPPTTATVPGRPPRKGFPDATASGAGRCVVTVLGSKSFATLWRLRLSRSSGFFADIARLVALERDVGVEFSDPIHAVHCLDLACGQAVHQ